MLLFEYSKIEARGNNFEKSKTWCKQLPFFDSKDCNDSFYYYS